MKKPEESQTENEMLPEYNFTDHKGTRGKYYRAYRQGHAVRIREDDGTVSIHYFTLAEGAIMLEPDVRRYFPTSESVNETLRFLISISPQEKATTKATPTK